MAMITKTAVIATFFVSLRVNMLTLVKTNPMANDDIAITILMASTNSGVMANAPPTPKLLKSDRLELIFVSNEMDVFETKTFADLLVLLKKHLDTKKIITAVIFGSVVKGQEKIRK